MPKKNDENIIEEYYDISTEEGKKECLEGFAELL